MDTNLEIQATSLKYTLPNTPPKRYYGESRGKRFLLEKITIELERTFFVLKAFNSENNQKLELFLSYAFVDDLGYFVNSDIAPNREFSLASSNAIYSYVFFYRGGHPHQVTEVRYHKHHGVFFLFFEIENRNPDSNYITLPPHVLPDICNKLNEGYRYGLANPIR